MKISELSSRSGVPVATVKFYLREGLLAAGEKSSQNQASYDDVAPLAVAADPRIHRGGRALRRVGASGARGRSTTRAFRSEWRSGSRLRRCRARPAPVVPIEQPIRSADERDLTALVADRGWTVDTANPGWALAARVIDDYAALGREDLLDHAPRLRARPRSCIAAADLQTVADAAVAPR